MTAAGIDVSHHNGKVDWGAVRRGGYSFAFAKCTEGPAFTDPKYDENRAGATAAGLIFGPYHFARFSSDPAASAARFLATSGLTAGQPWMLDCEDPHARSGHAANRAWIDVFAAHVMAVSGNAWAYTYASWWNQHIGPWAPHGMRRWIANFNDVTSPPLPRGWTSWQMWQWSSHGTVPGVSGPCDLNRFTGALTDLAAWPAAGPAAAKPKPLPPLAPPQEFANVDLDRIPARINLDDNGGWTAIVDVPWERVVSALLVGSDYSYTGEIMVAPASDPGYDPATQTKVTMAEPGNRGDVDIIVWAIKPAA